MDEVKAMAQAGETTGKAVGTGVQTVRKSATQAGKTGVAKSRQAVVRAEQELANHGLTPDELQERLTQKATGLSRKELAKRGKRARKKWDKKAVKSRKQWEKNTKAARKEIAAMIDPAPKKGRRKWPWVLLVLIGLGAAAAVALSRRPEELPAADAEHEFPTHDSDGRHASNNGSHGHGDLRGADRSNTLGSDQER